MKIPKYGFARKISFLWLSYLPFGSAAVKEVEQHVGRANGSESTTRMLWPGCGTQQGSVAQPTEAAAESP